MLGHNCKGCGYAPFLLLTIVPAACIFLEVAADDFKERDAGRKNAINNNSSIRGGNGGTGLSSDFWEQNAIGPGAME